MGRGLARVGQDKLSSRPAPHPSLGKLATNPPSWEAWEALGRMVWAGGSAETPSGLVVDGRQLGRPLPLPPTPSAHSQYIPGNGVGFSKIPNWKGLRKGIQFTPLSHRHPSTIKITAISK